ncbi:MAG: hypothetical protein JOZ27_03855 [Caulobacteraceae bacterium]|nr:hypothetical protein [Caulobacteraceae bacterium]
MTMADYAAQAWIPDYHFGLIAAGFVALAAAAIGFGIWLVSPPDEE